MKIIELDASGWISWSDFYEALLAGLGAPDWHGRNINAFIDSMIIGHINAVEPPFRVQIDGLTTAGQEAVEELHILIDALAEEGVNCMICKESASIEIKMARAG